MVTTTPGVIDQDRRQLLSTAATLASDAIRPFRVNFSDAELTEMRRRIGATQWPDRETVTPRCSRNANRMHARPTAFRICRSTYRLKSRRSLRSARGRESRPPGLIPGLEARQD
jgi:hypothetical protein